MILIFLKTFLLILDEVYPKRNALQISICRYVKNFCGKYFDQCKKSAKGKKTSFKGKEKGVLKPPKKNCVQKWVIKTT